MKKILKLPLYLLIAGIIYRFITMTSIRFLMSIYGPQSDKVMKYFEYISIIAFLIIFVFIGLMVRKNYNMKECFQSITLVFVYTLVMVGVERLLYSGGN